MRRFFASIVYCPGSNIVLSSELLLTAVCQDFEVLRVAMTFAVDHFRVREITDMIISPRMFCHIRFLLAMSNIFQIF